MSKTDDDEVLDILQAQAKRVERDLSDIRDEIREYFEIILDGSDVR